MTEDFVVRATVLETAAVVIAVTDSAYVAANAKRLGLYLAPGTQPITYSTLGAAVGGQGWVIPANGSGAWLDFGTHGNLVTKAWRAIAPGGAQTVNSIELIRAE